MRSWVPTLIVAVAVSAAACIAPQAAQQPKTTDVPAVKPAPATAAQATTTKPAQPTTKPAQPTAKPVQTAAQRPSAARLSNGQPVPPLQYVCTMVGDEGVLEDKPGKCPNPKCGMDLKPVRLTEAFSSITHPTQFIQLGPGKDRIDGSALVPITASVFWTCPGSEDHLTDPGKCTDGSARQEKLERRPHGDHNPRHGGQFFMADDAWHHLEGTYPRGGPFRVYFYDDFTRPMAVKGFTATAAIVDKDDKEVASFPLAPGRGTNVMEAALKGAATPLKINFRVQFSPTDKQRLFNFAFAQPTTEPVAPAVTTRAAPPATARPPAAPPAAAASGNAATQSTPPPTAIPAIGAPVNVSASSLTMSRAEATQVGQELPNNTGELLKLLDLRAAEVKTLVQDGNFGMVYVPTMMAKDVALAIGDHAAELPDRQRAALGSAVRRLVLSAWRLDQYGDLGNREKIIDAHGIFAAAVADIKAAYAQSR